MVPGSCTFEFFLANIKASRTVNAVGGRGAARALRKNINTASQCPAAADADQGKCRRQCYYC